MYGCQFRNLERIRMLQIKKQINSIELKNKNDKNIRSIDDQHCSKEYFLYASVHKYNNLKKKKERMLNANVY